MKKALRIIGAVVVLLIFVSIIASSIFMTGLDKGKKVVVGTINLSTVADGTYEGNYILNRWTNTLKVTVKDHKITNIVVVKDVVFKLDAVTKGVFSAVIDKQSLAIDIQSGATVTTKAYLKSIENALKGN
ncbi:MAG: FMN-binding protein [Erysipelotrichaceae bacterium]